MIVLVDMSSLLHAYFHVRKVEDLYDVTERTLTRLEKLRDYFVEKGRTDKRFKDVTFTAVFDNPTRKTFRHLIFPDYKGDRTKHDDLPEIEEATLEAVSHDSDWKALVAPELMEADDVMASICKQYAGKVVIHSEDRDCHAMLDDGRVTILKKSNTPEPGAAMELKWFTARDLYAKYGFLPRSWREYQLLVGGKDNVPGWDGVGEKKATELILDCVDFENVDVDQHGLNKTQRESYEQFKTMLPILKQIRTLRPDLDLKQTKLKVAA